MKKIFDVIIIGFGKGGKILVGDLVNRGLKVVLIEKLNKMYGGICVNVVCILIKSLENLVNSVKIKNINFWDEV